MLNIIRSIFDSAQFVPHGMCLLWRPDLLALHGGSDVLIALAYFTIPVLILRATRQRPDLIDPAVARLFAAFITACALSHTGAFLTLWYPAYGILGLIKLLTAIVSVYTAIQLARLLPAFLSLPSRKELIRKNALIVLREREANEAREAHKKMSEFAHIASHDLKAPIRGISNQAQFIEEDHGDTLPPEARRRLNRITDLCQQVETLISTLLRYSSIGTTPARKRVDVKNIIDKAVGSLDEFLEEHNAQVEIEADLPSVAADPAEVDTVFRNLIMNGVAYNNADTKRISIGYVQEALVRGHVIKDAFYVKDNGIGIKDGFQDTIFRMFKRLHHEGEYGAGTGAGLSFVKKIVETVGGTIDVTSKPDEGSTFFVSFTDQGRSAEQPEDLEALIEGSASTNDVGLTV